MIPIFRATDQPNLYKSQFRIALQGQVSISKSFISVQNYLIKHVRWKHQGQASRRYQNKLNTIWLRVHQCVCVHKPLKICSISEDGHCIVSGIFTYEKMPLKCLNLLQPTVKKDARCESFKCATSKLLSWITTWFEQPRC